jgi:transposase-like protein
MMNVMAKSTEVSSKATRRRFPTSEKIRILREADACTEKGEIGALMRREGIYSSHLSTWRAQRAAGQLGESPRRRGPVPAAPDSETVNGFETRIHNSLVEGRQLISLGEADPDAPSAPAGLPWAC